MSIKDKKSEEKEGIVGGKTIATGYWLLATVLVAFPVGVIKIF